MARFREINDRKTFRTTSLSMHTSAYTLGKTHLLVCVSACITNCLLVFLDHLHDICSRAIACMIPVC